MAKVVIKPTTIFEGAREFWGQRKRFL